MSAPKTAPSTARKTAIANPSEKNTKAHAPTAPPQRVHKASLLTFEICLPRVEPRRPTTIPIPVPSTPPRLANTNGRSHPFRPENVNAIKAPPNNPDRAQTNPSVSRLEIRGFEDSSLGTFTLLFPRLCEF